MKQEGGFVRFDLNPKYCDMQESMTTLGAKLLSAQNSQTAMHYLSHPEVTTKTLALPAVVVESESEDEEDAGIAEDIRQSKQHEAQRWAAAKKPAKDKGKAIVLSQQKKKPVVASQAPREKLLGSSINAEKARLSRETQSQVQNDESKVDDKKRKRDSVMPTPSPKVHTPHA
ncbi:hypothetical protein R1sor_011461 [Riccia sorocarpa]|uniref:Uncharacterized protein n=1 Tax=Riccia sorocarpa TaxID=122646 RepID=A0ABD3I4T9_9MARC